MTEDQISELRAAHRVTKNKRAADRIKAVYSVAIGHSVNQVSSILMLDEDTLRGYLEKYSEGGLPGLLENNHKGGFCRLSSEQLSVLHDELSSKIYLTTSSIISYVAKKFSVTYSVTGMRDLLHRIGYEYKKPKLVPGNPDLDAQDDFIAYYEDFMENKASDTEVLFVDGVHPEHNTMAAYGWLKRGEKRLLPTNCGRQRLNLHGAINAETYQTHILESKTINAESTIDLLTMIEQAYPKTNEIHIILDNARYHYSKDVVSFLENSKINLVFLPPYSPNLNLIERLWKFFKKNVLYNTYYKTFDMFRKAAINFFRNIGQQQKELEQLMSGDFQTL